MIKIEKVSVSYDYKHVLKKISATFKPGEITGLIGPNGAGKSTLLKTCIGLVQAYSGEIFYNDKLLLKNKFWVKQNASYASENAELLPYLTGKEFLLMLCKIHKLQNSEVKINFFLDMLGLQQKKDLLINSYSHGMKQKIAVAAALISEPKFILLDESLNGMDSISLSKVFKYLTSLKDKNVLILITSHNVQLIQKICDSVLIINNGNIISTILLEELNELKKTDEGFLKKYIQLINE